VYLDGLMYLARLDAAERDAKAAEASRRVLALTSCMTMRWSR
jgi:hypothetical protein